MTKFYRCPVCGNIIQKIEDKHVPVHCCGQVMQELVPNTTDAANEKHVPLVEVNGKQVKVTIASVLHPMEEAHSIQWIYLETNKGGMLKYLSPNTQPVAEFCLSADETPIRAFEYCNLHGLWSTEISQ